MANLEEILKDVDPLLAQSLQAVAAASGLDELERIRVGTLGKKGSLSALMGLLGGVSPDARKEAGARLNAAKLALSEALDARKLALEADALDERLARETVDVTLSVRPEQQGRIHPISQTIDEVVAIFGQMGFAVAEGPDIEDDFHNFTALNFPPEHPARLMHDTFFLPEKADGSRHLLRTHTSPVQVRTMLAQKPPIRVIIPGRTYRCDSDMTHTPMFHQVEGLVIDKTTNMGHLKGCLIEFVKTYFRGRRCAGALSPVLLPLHRTLRRSRHRLLAGRRRIEDRPRAFRAIQRRQRPFGRGVPTGWRFSAAAWSIPNVLKNCGIDPDEYQGFAFGMGIERIAMLKYGIPDLRTFFDSDLRWLKHYGFVPLDVPTLSGGLAR